MFVLERMEQSEEWAGKKHASRETYNVGPDSLTPKLSALQKVLENG